MHSLPVRVSQGRRSATEANRREKMGRNAVIFMVVYCFIKLMNGQIWTGTCGRSAMEKLGSWFSSRLGVSAASSGNGIHELSTAVLPYTSPRAPTQFQHILDANTWLISITAVSNPEWPAVIGHAALIRVHPDVEESDIAITSADVCQYPINDHRHRHGYQARFGAYDSKHGFNEQVGIDHCWHHTDYDYLQPGRNNIGIIKLDRKIPFANRIEPICLPGYDERITFTRGTDGRVVCVPSYATVHHFNLTITRPNECQIRAEAVFCVEPTAANERKDNLRVDGAPFVSIVNGKPTILGTVIQRPKGTLEGPTPISRLSAFLEVQGWLERTIQARSRVWEGRRRN